MQKHTDNVSIRTNKKSRKEGNYVWKISHQDGSCAGGKREFEEEDVKIRGVRIEEEEDKELELHTTTVVIETENGAKTMGKPVGTYITMEAPNMSVPDEGYHREISEKTGRASADTYGRR